MTIITYTGSFKVHSTNVFVLGAKTNIANFAKMTGKDDPTISCTHLMVKTKRFSGPENNP